MSPRLFYLTLLLVWFSQSTLILAQSVSRRAMTDSLSRQVWYPNSYPPGMQPTEPRRGNYMFATIAELLDWQAGGTPIRAISLTDNLIRQGGLHKLRQLKQLQYVHLAVSEQAKLDSVVSALPESSLLVLDFSAGYGTAVKPEPLLIPVHINQFPALRQVSIAGGRYDLERSIERLGGVPTLRELSIHGIYDQSATPVKLPQSLGKLRQLTGLNLSFNSAQIEGVVVLASLPNLESLSVYSFRASESGSEPQAFGNALAKLTKLTELVLPVSWLPADFKPDWRRLERLHLTENSPVSVRFPVVGALPSLTHLTLQNVTLPADVCAYERLIHLTASIDSLTQLPDCWGKLKHLEVVNLSGRGLRTLPASLGEVRSLTSLSLFNTSVDSLPETLANLTELQFLAITNGKLRTLPAWITKNTNLKSLLLSNNKLSALPDDIDKLRKLQGLHLANNQLTRLPDRLANLPDLQNLHVEQNQISQLPVNFGRLRKLKQLSLSKNQLTTLPADFAQLDSLRALSFDQNKLVSLPAGIGRLKKLTALNLARNQISQIPESIGELTQLTSLYIMDNPVEAIPASIGNLTALTSIDISKTKIKMLPASIGKLRKLNRLSVSQSELMTLPPEIGNCQELNSIMLSDNPLIGLPESMGRLKKLANLSLSGGRTTINKLTELPDSLRFCTALKMVQLSSLPNLAANEAMAMLIQSPALEYLTMTDTPLNQLPATGWKTSAIHTLALGSNALTELPPALLDAPKLQSISLYGNPLPKGVASSFRHIDQLRVAMADAGWVSLEGASRKSWPIAQGFMQSSGQKASMREWEDALEALNKAVLYAPDSMVAIVYGQRAELHFFRKQYELALADFDRALANWSTLKMDSGAGTMPSARQDMSGNRVLWGMRKSMVLQAVGQIDAALAEIRKALVWLPSSTTAATNASSFRFPNQFLQQIEAQAYTVQGNLLARKNQFVEADTAYNRAMRAYEAMTYSEPGAQLTIVELGIITGQYDRARKVFARMSTYATQGRFGTLSEYMKQALNVAEGKTTGPEATAELKKVISRSRDRIVGWSFDLFDAWLNRTTLPADRRDALRELTALAKERQWKME